MSTEMSIDQKFDHFIDNGVKTQIQEQTDNESRRVSTEQIPMKKSADKKFKLRLFEKTQLPSISTKASYKQNQFVLNSAIEKLIEQEIKKGKFFISSTPTKYPIKPLKKQALKILTPQQINQQKLNQMEVKRLQVIQMLRQLENQELQLKRKSVSLRYQKQKNQKKSIKKQKSFYSPEQKRQVKKMFIRNKMIQHQLKQKTEQKMQEYRRIVETQRQRHFTQIQRHKSLSKSRIQQRRQFIEEKKSATQKQRQRMQKNLEEVKNRRYLYQQMLEKDEKLAMQQMEQFTKKLESIKNKMKVTIVDQIKQHKKKFSQLYKKKNTKFNKSKFSLDLNSPYLNKIEDNYFTRLMKAERLTKKQEEEMTKSRPFELKQKIKQFSQRCETQVRPKIKITEESRFVPIERNRSMNSLNYFQQYEKGNEYLTIAKKLKKCDTIEDERVLNSKEFESIPNPLAKISYKNYLKDMRQKSQQNPQNAKKKFALYLQKQGSISDYNSLQKAVTFSQSIEAKNKRTKNQKLIDAVQNKIQLLKMVL